MVETVDHLLRVVDGFEVIDHVADVLGRRFDVVNDLGHVVVTLTAPMRGVEEVQVLIIGCLLVLWLVTIRCAVVAAQCVVDGSSGNTELFGQGLHRLAFVVDGPPYGFVELAGEPRRGGTDRLALSLSDGNLAHGGAGVGDDLVDVVCGHVSPCGERMGLASVEVAAQIFGDLANVL